jgi:hypothetical protein
MISEAGISGVLQVRSRSIRLSKVYRGENERLVAEKEGVEGKNEGVIGAKEGVAGEKEGVAGEKAGIVEGVVSEKAIFEYGTWKERIRGIVFCTASRSLCSSMLL